MTSIALVQLRFALLTGRLDELRPAGEPLHWAAPPYPLLDVRERWTMSDPWQVAEDQLGHRDPFLRGPDLKRAVQLIRNVAYLDHLHVVHMFARCTHVIKGRTRRSAALAGVPEEALRTARAPCRQRSARRAVAGSAERAPAADGRGDGAAATGEPALAAGPRAALPGGGPPAPPAPGRGPRAPRRSWCGWGAPGGA